MFFAIWILLFHISLRNNCQNQSPGANTGILSSCRPFNVLQNTLEVNAPRMSLFTWQEHPEMPVQCLHFSSWLLFFISVVVFEECHYTGRVVLWNFLPEPRVTASLCSPLCSTLQVLRKLSCWWECCWKQPGLLGNSRLKRKAWCLLPLCPEFLEWLLACFFWMCVSPTVTQAWAREET